MAAKIPEAAVIDREQAELNAGLEAWAQAHIDSPAHDTQGIVPFNPVLRPEQSINTTHVDAEWPRLPGIGIDAPTVFVLWAARRKLAGALGSGQAANAFVDDFKKPGPGGEPLTATLQNALDRHEHVGLVLAHAVMGDVMIAPVGLTVATGSRRITRSTVMIMNKLMTRECQKAGAKAGPVVDIGKPWGDQVFVIPDSDNTERYGLSKEVKTTVNMGGMKKLLGDMMNADRHPYGRLISIAPFGSGVVQELDEGGQLQSLRFPVLPEQSAKLLKRCHKLLPVTLWRDREAGTISWRIGELQDVAELKTLSSTLSHHHHVADYVKNVLSDQLRDLAGVPVSVTEAPRFNLAQRLRDFVPKQDAEA